MIEFKLNEKTVSADVPEDMPLLWVIRDVLGMTGTKFGCGIAQCGACTVHVDGQPRRSCVARAADIAGSHITTIEGIGRRQLGRRCKKHGLIWRWCSAAFASPVRS